jgi:hypothetical protein
MKNQRQCSADGQDEVIHVALDILAEACIESDSKSLIRSDDIVNSG